MAKFRKRPVVVVVEATRWHEGKGDQDALRGWAGLPPFAYPEASFNLTTLEGAMRVSVGDWVIRGVAGELHPCRDDIFRATHEVAEPGEDDCGLK